MGVMVVALGGRGKGHFGPARALAAPRLDRCAVLSGCVCAGGTQLASLRSGHYVHLHWIVAFGVGCF